MPTPSNPSLDRQSQAAVVASLISTDPEMQQLARQYVMLGLREMINQLQRGDASTRAAIARSMSGAVTNLFTQSAADDGLNELRVEMHSMVAEMRGEIQGHGDDGDEAASEERREAEKVERHRVMVPKS